ncbi:MAG: ABC transporter permease [Chryseotalea sp. WA131a]|nr:MAG: ABC transporter permease [Chryseotalea sp. WA131a]
MIKHYLTHFVRNLQRQKLFTFINILGLTVGIASSLLIYLYARHEFSFDRFHHNADHIYRLNQTFIWGESSDNEFASTGPGVAYAVKEEIPEVKLLTSIHTPGDFLVSYTNQKNEVISFEQTEVLAADSNFFKMFNFPLVKGDAAFALQQANTIVLTESTAKKYFGGEEPMGKLILMGAGENQKTYEVTGVAKDLPSNTYLQFDVLMSMNSFPEIKKRYWSWVWTQLETYVLLDENASLEKIKAKLATVPRKHAEATLQRTMNISFDDYIKSGKNWELFLQPITAIHLPAKVVYNRLINDGNLTIIYSLIGAAIFIILLSCVNFMNLSTAQFTKRIKDASVRKILGLGKVELGIGYFIEAFIFCTIALLIALALIQILLPGFNLLVGRELQINLLNDPQLIIALLSLALVMSLLSGSYPAIFLSAYHPVEAMKGKLKTGNEGKSFRNGLVVFQFSVSIALIICTAVVFQQLKFVGEKDLGFDRENLVVISHAERLSDGESAVNAAFNVPGVVNASLSTSVPPNLWGGDKFSAEGMGANTFPLNLTTADERYLSTLGVKLKYGRNFLVNTPGDVNRVILNEAAVKRIGWDLNESAIGKKIEYPGGEVRFEVIGVVEDYHYWSLGNPIEPMAIFHLKNKDVYGANTKQYVVLRMEGQTSANWEKSLASLAALWKEKAGDVAFDYSFVDQAFANTFKAERNFGKTLTVLATLGIIIAALGLLGMIVYTLEQRTKEIGIRKVAGASAKDILILISTGFTKLIMIAFVIGAPLSYWLMTKWLQGFTYHISPSPYIYIVAGMGTLLVALAITSYHSIKAATLNPVEVLRDE